VNDADGAAKVADPIDEVDPIEDVRSGDRRFA
jgi:hypothetical protein